MGLVNAHNKKPGNSLTVIPKGKFLVFLRKKGDDSRTAPRTQKEVEDAAGLPALRLSMYERGVPIPLDHLEKLSSYYGMPARELVDPASLEKTLLLVQRIYKLFELIPQDMILIDDAEVTV